MITEASQPPSNLYRILYSEEMKPMNYTEARANLASVLSSATEDLEEVVITRSGHQPAVVVALSEYEALKETAHLLGNPANAGHLERSIAEHRAGGASPRELVDIDGSAPADAPTPRTPLRIYGLPASASANAAFPSGRLIAYVSSGKTGAFLINSARPGDDTREEVDELVAALRAAEDARADGLFREMPDMGESSKVAELLRILYRSHSTEPEQEPESPDPGPAASSAGKPKVTK
ncbi:MULTISPECIES: type II toxin-antitoxin system prevent-host-death family antitoxin [unclassified Nocardia]|uniref:type II toxin-antitoxin system Phd/YefM family antitoxin n=1 Tax=unclassified Nocardia TaxID=2637762 RepID=UPI0024A7D1CB|nr:MULTISPECIES: type II toxin-antitoxin system prevent-host-death family antitoxin [unclassified Nocardia]